MLIDLFREIGQTLSHNKLRTALTGFAVAWGIFLLIILLGLSRGIINSFERWQNPDAAGSMTVWGGWTNKPYQGYKEGRSIELKEADIKAITDANLKFTSTVGAKRSIDSATIATQKDYLSGGITGVFPGAAKTDRIGTLRGRFINEADIEQSRKVVVLRSESAEQLFGTPDAVGKRVKILGLSWLVVGVYEHEWNNRSYVPFTTVMDLSGNDGQVSELTVMTEGLKSMDDGSAEEQGIREALGKAHQFAPDDEGAVHIWNRFNNYLQQQQGNNILTTAVWILGVLTLLSGIVGVSNIMFVSVRERTHEIGIRRAIGAKPRNILTQVVAESVAITTLFGYIGIVGGTAVLALLNSQFGQSDFMRNPSVNLSVAFQVTVALIVAGAFAGLFPAIKATKVKPVEALRYE